MELAKDIASIHNCGIKCDVLASEVLAQSIDDSRHCGLHFCRLDSAKVCDDCADCCEDTTCILDNSQPCTVCTDCANL